MPPLCDATPSAPNAPITVVSSADNRAKVPGINALITPPQRTMLAHAVTALKSSTAHDYVGHIFPLFDTHGSKPALVGFMTKDDTTVDALESDGFEPEDINADGAYCYGMEALQTLAKKGHDIARAVPPRN